MKPLVFILSCLLSISIFAQETEKIAEEVTEEFIPINIEEKEAFMSTKTGEYTYREHAITDPTRLKTTPSGVVYTDIYNYTVKKGETLSVIAKKNGVTVSEIKKLNKVTNSNLKIGSKIKIEKKMLIKSSSPVKGTSGDTRIIASLPPGQSPGALAPPPPVSQIQNKLVKTDKTRQKPLKAKYKVKKSIKNPIFGLENNTDEIVEVAEQTEKIITIKDTKKETKRERLKRLKEEMKALEAELEDTEDAVEKPLVNIQKDVLKDHDSHDGHDHSKQAKKKDKVAQEVNASVNKEKNKESLSKKASRIISKVKKTNKEVSQKTSKTIKQEAEALKSDKEASNETPEDINTQDDYFYTVKKGNSLWSISKMYGMTIQEIKIKNKLKSNYLKVGQKLKVNSTLKKQ